MQYVRITFADFRVKSRNYDMAAVWISTFYVCILFKMLYYIIENTIECLKAPEQLYRTILCSSSVIIHTIYASIVFSLSYVTINRNSTQNNYNLYRK